MRCTNVERVEIADCYLLSDNLANAEIFLKPLRSEIEKLSDADIARAPLEKQYGPALQLLVMAALKRGAYSDIDYLLLNRCRTWTRSSSCAAKIYSNSLRFYSNSAYEGARKVLAIKSKPMDPWSETTLLIGAGLANSWQRSYPTADANFDAAIKASEKVIALKKIVYETWATDLHRRGDREQVKIVVKRAHRDLASIDNAAKNKLRLIASLNDPKLSQKALQTFLNRQEVSYRSRGDVGLLDLIGPEALRTKQTKDLLKFVEASRRQIQRQNSATASVLQTYVLWEVRSLMGLGRLAEARQRLQLFKGSLGDSVAGHHLRGSINTALAKTPVGFCRCRSRFSGCFKNAIQLG